MKNEHTLNLWQKRKIRLKKILSSSNFKIIIFAKADDSQISGSKSFYSNKTFDSLVASILSSSFAKKSSNKELRVTIQLCDIKNNKTKHIKIFVPRRKNDTLRDLVCRAKEEVMMIRGLTDVKKNRYRVEIVNYSVGINDKRSFSFYTKDTLQKVFDELHHVIDEIIFEEKDDDIIFSSLSNNQTHRLVVYASGCSECYKDMKMKSFGFILPNFSSSEVIERMRRKLE